MRKRTLVALSGVATVALVASVTYLVHARRERAEQAARLAEQRARADAALLAEQQARALAEQRRLDAENYNRWLMDKAAYELKLRREAVVSERNELADSLVELASSYASKCRNNVRHLAQQHYSLSDGTAAWVIEITEPTFVCLNSQGCVAEAAQRAADRLRDVDAMETLEATDQVLRTQRDIVQGCMRDSAARYNAKMARTVAAAALSEPSQGRLFSIVTESGSSVSRIVRGMVVRSDSSAALLPVMMATPNLDQWSSSHAGVFVAVMPASIAPTWTMSIDVPLEIYRYDTTLVRAHVASMATFTIDAVEGGFIDQVHQIGFPKGALNEARDQLRRAQQETVILETQLAESRRLAVLAPQLKEQLDRAEYELGILQRYTRRLQDQRDEDSGSPILDKVIEGVATKAITSTLFAMGRALVKM